MKQLSIDEYSIIVSEFKHPVQSVQFQWFIESTVPCPILKAITGIIILTFYLFVT